MAMTVSDALAAIALLVSIASAVFSYKAHRETTRTNERESRREFDRERSEFLVRIEKSQKLFDRVSHRIASLLAQIDSQPDAVKSSLNNEVDQLRRDKDYLEGCMRQANSLWHENFDMSHDGLAYHKPRHLGLLENDQEFSAKALERAAAAEVALNRALAIFQPIIS